jgi:hypothetical protein
LIKLPSRVFDSAKEKQYKDFTKSSPTTQSFREKFDAQIINLSKLHQTTCPKVLNMTRDEIDEISLVNVGLLFMSNVDKPIFKVQKESLEGGLCAVWRDRVVVGTKGGHVPLRRCDTTISNRSYQRQGQTNYEIVS